jgi:hypothetical protein
VPEVRALMLDLDLEFEEVLIRAVAELWQREIGEVPRDIYQELDEMKEAIRLLQAGRAPAGEKNDASAD